LSDEIEQMDKFDKDFKKNLLEGVDEMKLNNIKSS
jgi:hypothetical protein